MHIQMDMHSVQVIIYLVIAGDVLLRLLFVLKSNSNR